MEKVIKKFKLSNTAIISGQRVSREQTDYVQRLAEKTNSKIPTERQMLDHCSRETMRTIIGLMKEDNTIELS